MAVHAVVGRDDHFVEAHVGGNARVLKQDAAHHPRAGANVAAMANPGGPGDAGAGFDAHTGADVHRPLNGDLVPRNAGVQADPDAGLYFTAWHLHFGHFTFEHALQYRPVIAHPANVNPFEGAVLGKKWQFLLDQLWEELGANVVHRVGRHQLEHFGLKNIDAGAGQC